MTAPVTPEPINVTAADVVHGHTDIGKLVTTVGLCVVMGIIVYLMLRSDKRAEEDHKRSKEFFDKWGQRANAQMNGHRAGSYDFDPQQAPNAAPDQV